MSSAMASGVLLQISITSSIQTSLTKWSTVELRS